MLSSILMMLPGLPSTSRLESVVVPIGSWEELAFSIACSVALLVGCELYLSASRRGRSPLSVAPCSSSRYSSQSSLSAPAANVSRRLNVSGLLAPSSCCLLMISSLFVSTSRLWL